MQMEDVQELVARQARAWEQGAVDAIVKDFALDADFISPGGHFHGHDAMRKMMVAFFASARDVRVEIRRVMAVPTGGGQDYANSQGAIEWHWGETRTANGARHEADDSIIFDLRDGKIVYWREYFDTGQMEKPR